MGSALLFWFVFRIIAIAGSCVVGCVFSSGSVGVVCFLVRPFGCFAFVVSVLVLL